LLRNKNFPFINKSLVLTILTVICPALFQLFYIRYVSYEVDPKIFGNFILLVTFASAVSAIFLTIPATAFTRFFNEAISKKNHINEFRSLMFPVNLLSFIAVVIYSYLMPQFDFYILFLVYVFLILQNNTSLNRQIVIQNLERERYFFVTLLEKSSKFIFPLIFFYYFSNLNSLLEGLVFGSIILTLMLFFYNRKYKFEFTFHKKRFKKYFFYAYPIIFTSVFSWVIVFSDRYFINYYLDSSSVGIYSLLAQIAAFTSLLNAVFSMYVNPLIYKLYSQDKKLAMKKLIYYIWALLSVIVIFLIVLVLIPKNYFSIIINPEVLENNYTTMVILIFSSICSVIQNSLSLFFTLLKRLEVLGLFWFFAAILNLFGNTLIKDFGIIAAAISTLIAYLFVVIANLVWINIVNRNTKYSD
jgi:O-antigen/teichoic acid export membrane protein